MKHVITFTLILIIGYSVRAQESSAMYYPSSQKIYSSNSLTINLFDQSNNFYYKNSNDTLVYLNEKGKTEGIKTTTNILFYDINKDSTFLLFPKDFNEKINAFIFEKEYLESSKSILFSNTDNLRHSFLLNNVNIITRPISQNIYLITYSHTTKKYSFWICKKTGENLKLVTTFENEDDLKIDVFNNNLLLFRKLDNTNFKIEKIKIE